MRPGKMHADEVDTDVPLALPWALIFIPYYLHTNPVGVAHARRTIHEVLANLKSGA